MDDFKIIYRILKYLCDSMDFDKFDSEGFTAARFGTNDNRFRALLVQLQESGYIAGLNIRRVIRQGDYMAKFVMHPLSPRITIAGLEYLHENGMMKKAANVAKGIVDIIA